LKIFIYLVHLLLIKQVRLKKDPSEWDGRVATGRGTQFVDTLLDLGTYTSPAGAIHTSPGQRPGSARRRNPPCKGGTFVRDVTPFQGSISAAPDPGPCPGLVCAAPPGRLRPEDLVCIGQGGWRDPLLTRECLGRRRFNLHEQCRLDVGECVFRDQEVRRGAGWHPNAAETTRGCR